jgi:hypothetical protein
MTMNRWGKALVVGSVVLALVGCRKKGKTDDDGMPVVRGSGVGSSIERKVAPFSRVSIGGNFDVTINVGKDGPLEFRGDDNLFEHLPSPVVNGELTLKPDATLKTTQPFRIAIATEKLEDIAVSVASKVTVHGVKADAFEVSVTGGAQLTAQGSAATLKVTSKTAAKVDLTALAAGEGIVTASEGSRIRLGHIEKLDATQSGIAMISYRGTPAVTKHGAQPKFIVAAD